MLGPTLLPTIMSLTDAQISNYFLSTLQNMGVRFQHAVENFHPGKVLFVQAAYNFLQELVLGICTKIPKNADYEDFLIKFVNINNRIHHFLNVFLSQRLQAGNVHNNLSKPFTQ